MNIFLHLREKGLGWSFFIGRCIWRVSGGKHDEQVTQEFHLFSTYNKLYIYKDILQEVVLTEKSWVGF